MATQGFAEHMLKFYARELLQCSKADQALFAKCLKKPCIKHAACEVMRAARNTQQYDRNIRRQVKILLKSLLETQNGQA